MKATEAAQSRDEERLSAPPSPEYRPMMKSNTAGHYSDTASENGATSRSRAWSVGSLGGGGGRPRAGSVGAEVRVGRAAPRTTYSPRMVGSPGKRSSSSSPARNQPPKSPVSGTGKTPHYMRHTEACVDRPLLLSLGSSHCAPPSVRPPFATPTGSLALL